jgi:hypothetical protein
MYLVRHDLGRGKETGQRGIRSDYFETGIDIRICKGLVDRSGLGKC